MTTLFTTQQAYNQGKADSAREVLEAVQQYFIKLDAGKTRTQYKRTVTQLKKLNNSTDMYVTGKGYAFIPHKDNRGLVRVALASSVITALLVIYACSCAIAWGWVQATVPTIITLG